MKTFLFRSMIGIFFGAFIAVIMTNSCLFWRKRSAGRTIIFEKFTRLHLLRLVFHCHDHSILKIRIYGLSQQTALHFVTVVILYFILSFGIGWVPFTVKSFLLALGLFIVSYSMFWTSFYLYFRKQAKKLNAELEGL